MNAIIQEFISPHKCLYPPQIRSLKPNHQSDKAVVVQSLSCARLFETPWTAALQAPLSFTISWGLLKVMSADSVMLSKHLILCHRLLRPPSLFPSIRVFSNELALHIRWPSIGASASLAVLILVRRWDIGR